MRHAIPRRSFALGYRSSYSKARRLTEAAEYNLAEEEVTAPLSPPCRVTGRTCARARLGMLALLDRTVNAEMRGGTERQRTCVRGRTAIREGREREREKVRDAERKGEGGRGRLAAAGRAVSCRQIYRVARADPEQCRFVLFCSRLRAAPRREGKKSRRIVGQPVGPSFSTRS